MHEAELKYAYLVPENYKKYAVDGVSICCDCGSVETTILTFAIYCRTCCGFRLFKERDGRCYFQTGTILDLD